MIPRKSNSLGLEFNYQVAGTSSEYNDLAKRKDAAGNLLDACLEDAVEHVVQHDMNTKFRDLFLHGREANAANGTPEFKGFLATTGTERKSIEVSKKKKDGTPYTITEWDESELDCFKRVLTEREENAEQYSALAQSAADLVIFDPSASEPTVRKPKVLPKKIVEKVDSIYAKGSLDKAIKVISKDIGKTFVPTPTTGDTTQDAANLVKDKETLGWLVADHAEWVSLNKSGF